MQRAQSWRETSEKEKIIQRKLPLERAWEKEGKTHFQMKVLEMASIYFYFTFETVPRETHGGHRSWEEGHRTLVLSAESHWTMPNAILIKYELSGQDWKRSRTIPVYLTKQALGRTDALESCGCSHPVCIQWSILSQTSTALPSEHTVGTRPEAPPSVAWRVTGICDQRTTKSNIFTLALAGWWGLSANTWEG